MAISRLHTWSAGEVLLASDLNSEFNNVLNNGADLVSPFTKSISMGGFALNFDAANTIALTATTNGLSLTGGAFNTAQGSSIASAATVNLDTATGNYPQITGVVTITAVTLSQGRWRWVEFAGILTLTNGASLILPGGANIVTAAGDTALFFGEAAGVVRCVVFQPARGQMATLTGTESLSNKTLVNPAGTTQTLTDAATIAWDASSGQVATVTPTANRTFGAPTNLKSGGRYMLSIIQDGTGGRTHTFNGVFKCSNGQTFPQPVSATGTTTVYDLVSPDGTNLYLNTSSLPAGAFLDWPSTSLPAGFLECDGSAVSRTTYASLFAVVSTTWGAGDASTTFNVPDLRGRVRIGRGTGTVAETVAAGSVDTGGDTFTVTSNNTKWVTGQAVILTTTSGLPAGLAVLTTYYLIRVTATTIRFASTLANAQAGTQIDLTTQGTGNHTLTGTLTARTLAEIGGEEAHAMSSTEDLAHTHTTNAVTGVGNSGGGAAIGVSGGSTATGSFGGNAAMNIMQSFGVVMTVIKY